jgi:hypothetical protein
MTKLYKQENGIWILQTSDGRGLELVSYDISSKIVDETIYIYNNSNNAPLYIGKISDLSDSAGISYGTKENLFAQVGDFFVKASSGGEAVLPNADVSLYIDSMHNLILNYPDTATDDYEINADGNLVLIY